MISISIWLCALICFALAVILPFTSKTSGRLNLVAFGLFFAALSHLVTGVVLH